MKKNVFPWRDCLASSFRFGMVLPLLAVVSVCIHVTQAEDVSGLRLVPFPKHVELTAGNFTLDEKLTLEAPAAAASQLGPLIGEEFQRAGLKAPEVHGVPGDAKFVRLSAKPGHAPTKPVFREQATPQDYVLQVQPDGVVCASPGDAGLAYAVQTLCQLIRANRRGNALPCLSIPIGRALRWRAFKTT